MKARYSKFLNAKPKVYGIEVLDIYIIFLVWFFCSLFGVGEFLKMFIPVMVGICLIYYKKKFRPNFLYFILKKKKYTKVHIGLIQENNHEA